MPGRGGATVLDDLPEWIVIEEILVRLSPKDLLRCRAVCKCWHSATSAGKFILDHHRRQPLLPILSHAVDQGDRRLFVPRPRDAGVGQQRLCPVIWTSDYGEFQAALDGLLVVCHGEPTREFFICNPVTRKCAPLGKPQNRPGSHPRIVGFYRHQPSGEYRVLWVSCSTPTTTTYDAQDKDYGTFYYVVAVGSNDTRCIRQGCIPQPTSSTPALDLALRGGLACSSILPPARHRGSLHWILGKYHGSDGSYIMAFNTAAETFRLMRQPTQSSLNFWLLEMDGTLALCSISSDKNTIDVWVMQDYDTETWSFKRINLLGVDPSPPVDSAWRIRPRMAVLNDGELLIQITSRRVLRYGKFLGYVKNEEDQEISFWITKHYLQESVIALPVFREMREEDSAIQEPPFFVGL